MRIGVRLVGTLSAWAQTVIRGGGERRRQETSGLSQPKMWKGIMQERPYLMTRFHEEPHLEEAKSS